MPGIPDNIDPMNPPRIPLANELADAFFDNDYARVKQITTAPGCPDDLKVHALRAAISAGSLMMVRIILDQAKPEMTAAQAMMVLLEAARKQQSEICACLAERNAAAGIARVDSYNIVFAKFGEEKMQGAIDALLKAAPEKQPALDAMLRAAVLEKKYVAMGGLIDSGAQLGDNATDTLAKLTIAVNHHPFYLRRDDYLALVEKCAAITPPGYLMDCYAGVSAMMATGTMQYSETAEAFLRHGADPWYGLKSTGLDRQLAPESPIRAIFVRYEESYTAQQRAAFRGFFGDTFTLADLRQEIDADGTTGLMLAAKARLLPDVMQKTGLSAADLLQTNNRQQSLLLLAAQRGDAATLLDAGYWRRTDPAILAKLEILPQDVKDWADIPAFAAALDRAALKEQAVRFKLGARPKP